MRVRVRVRVRVRAGVDGALEAAHRGLEVVTGVDHHAPPPVLDGPTRGQSAGAARWSGQRLVEVLRAHVRAPCAAQHLVRVRVRVRGGGRGRDAAA